MNRIAAIFVAILVGILSVGVIINAAEAASAPCPSFVLEPGTETGFVWFRWESAVSDPCLSLIAPQRGVVEITGGWVFTAPLKLWNVNVPTYFTDGELAPHIFPITQTL